MSYAKVYESEMKFI